MDVFPTALSAGLGLVVASTSYLISKVLNTDKTFSAHVASDLVMFERFLANFNDLKQEQRDQTQKLDRLVEQSFTARYASAAQAAVVTSAAATALDLLESAKKAALEVVASAAREAKKAV